MCVDLLYSMLAAVGKECLTDGRTNTIMLQRLMGKEVIEIGSVGELLAGCTFVCPSIAMQLKISKAYQHIEPNCLICLICVVTNGKQGVVVAKALMPSV